MSWPEAVLLRTRYVLISPACAPALQELARVHSHVSPRCTTRRLGPRSLTAPTLIYLHDYTRTMHTYTHTPGRECDQHVEPPVHALLHHCRHRAHILGAGAASKPLSHRRTYLRPPPGLLRGPECWHISPRVQARTRARARASGSVPCPASPSPSPSHNSLDTDLTAHPLPSPHHHYHYRYHYSPRRVHRSAHIAAAPRLRSGTRRPGAVSQQHIGCGGTGSRVWYAACMCSCPCPCQCPCPCPCPCQFQHPRPMDSSHAHDQPITFTYPHSHPTPPPHTHMQTWMMIWSLQARVCPSSARTTRRSYRFRVHPALTRPCPCPCPCQCRLRRQ